MPEELTMCTTTDGDIHVFPGSVELIRMKSDHNKWIETIDGRFVKASAIVSLWTPNEDELRGFMSDVNVFMLTERTEE